MRSKCRLPPISTVHFKRQLSSCRQKPHKSFSLTPFPASTHYDNNPQKTFSFISNALKISAKFGFIFKAKQLHSHVIKLGYYTKLSIQNQILHVYVKYKEFSDVHKLLDEMPERNVVSWNTVICGVVVGSRNDFESSFYLGFGYFRRMLLEMVGPDCITFNGLIRACIEVNGVGIGRQLHCFVVKLGLCLNCFVGSALVDLYAKFGLAEDARRVFDGVLVRDLVLWNVMVSCYALNGLPKEAFGVFDLLQLEGVKGDHFTFSSLVSSCGILGSYELGQQFHGLIIKMCFDLDAVVVSALVDMYAKTENIDDARKAFDEMVVRNVVSWTTLIVAYGRDGDGKEAMRLLREMLYEDFDPDELTFASILSSCGNLSSIIEIVELHAYVIKKGLESFISIANSLINAYSKCGNIAGAFQSFGSISEPDLLSWTSIIGACAFHGFPRKSIEMFEKMLSSDMRPDQVAFLGVLSACSHGGLVSEGLHYVDLMTKAYQIVPDSDHYTCLIDLLGRAGLLDEAYNVLISMSIEPGSNTIGAFIGACRVHGNVRLAKWATESLLLLEPNKPVNYALMSNIYASSGHWFDVARVRKMMRVRCDRKFPGCSWMEISGEVHVFVSSDTCHPQALEVYAMLRILVKQMKDEDWV